MDYHDDFPPESSSFARVSEAKPSFFSVWFSGLGNMVAGLFIGAAFFCLWYLAVVRASPFSSHFQFQYLVIFPAFWWLGMPFVLRYYYFMFMVVFRGRHWTPKTAAWYVIYCWAPLVWIASLTPFALYALVALAIVAFILSRRKGVA